MLTYFPFKVSSVKKKKRTSLVAIVLTHDILKNILPFLTNIISKKNYNDINFYKPSFSFPFFMDIYLLSKVRSWNILIFIIVNKIYFMLKDTKDIMLKRISSYFFTLNLSVKVTIFIPFIILK